MSYLSHREKLSILSRLIELAKSDGILNLTEISYIFWTAQQLDVTPLELKHLFDQPVDQSNPMTLRDRVTLFYSCLAIMYIDAVIHPEEVKKCRQMATDLRLPEKQTAELFETIKLSQPELISLDQLLNHFGINY